MGNLYTCLCEEGWRGGGDNQVCTANVCLCDHGKAGVGGECPVNGKHRCVSCDHGYDLQMDDTCVDACANISCNNRGQCYAGKCYCNPPYSGIYCQDAPDPCANVRCGLHGKCFDGTCFCEDFYTGDHCEVSPGLGMGQDGTVVVH